MTNSSPAASAVQTLVDELVAGYRGPQAALLSEFASITLRYLPEEDAHGRSRDDWAALIAQFLRFGRERRQGQVMIRLINPDRAADGWELGHSVLQVVSDDMPFIIDSVAMVLAERGLSMHLLLHPVIHAVRDPSGHLFEIDARPEPQGNAEAWTHFEIDRLTDVEQIEALAAQVRSVFDDVSASVADWSAMRDRMVELANEIPARLDISDGEVARECEAYLRWVADNHFTFLGYRHYRVATVDGEEVLKAVDGSGLGILRQSDRHVVPRSIKALQSRRLTPSEQMEPLVLTKSNSRSTVHRAGYMDYVGVLLFDANGVPIGEHRFLGLYTSSAYNCRPWDIPLVRRRVEAVVQRSGLSSGGHAGKALIHILETLPRDELFQGSSAELSEIALGILSLQERQRTRLFVRRDRFGRFFSCLVFIPRDRFNTEVREKLTAILKRSFRGEKVDFAVQIDESVLARLHVVVRPKPGDHVDYVREQIEQELVAAVRSWQDALREALTEQFGEEAGLKLYGRYGLALPASYRERFSPVQGALDAYEIAELKDSSDLRMVLYRSGERFGFKIFRYGSMIPLSEALPMLEFLGLRVYSERPYEIRISERLVAFVQDFEMVFERGSDIDLDNVRSHFQTAFEKIWRGEAEKDGFNRLILGAMLDWREVAMLRACAKYLLQIGVPFSQPYMEQTLGEYPLAARLLVEYFHARFDPARDNGESTQPEVLAHELRRLATDEPRQRLVETYLDQPQTSRADRAEAALNAIRSLLELVRSLDEERILRGLASVIKSTLRTNYFQLVDGRPPAHIALKIESQAIVDLPKPKPYREIFVYSPRVEGIHLRFGPVARGGLRWSDRREDFRTEVLGLVKAQMVKNTVIVPVGAKGGFFVKQPPVGGDRDQIYAEGVACYRTFINGLLDLTDNLVDGALVHPQQVVRYDDPDPYLVVAADKGTAAFSDIANGVAAEHGFWLGDAFASGGSFGYDHKKMGITARGGWESVKHHFRALARDCQSEPFTVVGIGDMSGDVFGNGMLLSRQIRLVAAFDHRHIFIDPNPDPELSFVERERLFALPRSTWADYNASKLSAGGGIYPRSAKSIPVSAEFAAILDIEAGSLAPNELIRAILKAPVDLLFNGGIGTYVKASTETHADVGDRTNNALRIDGRELRAKIVCEGGNLGMTQLGRIEAARHGVMLNTDFIDNSAGVDTSDHEVNIKILLNAQVAAGELTLAERNAMLVEMTDEVADLVLRDNILQNWAITIMERLGSERLGAKQHFIRYLESTGLLDRQIEFLPSEEEFADRRARGAGLYRPELAILLSYSKMHLYQELLASDVPEDPYLSRELLRYFPQPIQERHASALEGHRLKREIIATQVTNSTVNRMGATFALRMQEDTGAGFGRIAKAYSAAREIIAARAMWDELAELNCPVSAVVDAKLKLWNLLRHLTRWILNLPGTDLDIASIVDRYAPGVAELLQLIDKILPRADRLRLESGARDLVVQGIPEPLAVRIVHCNALFAAMDIISVSGESGLSLEQVAKAHFAISDALQLEWLREEIESLPVEGRWHAHARGVLRDELNEHHRSIVRLILKSSKAERIADRVRSWLDANQAQIRYTQTMLAEMRSSKSLDFATATVAVRRLAHMVNAANGSH